jgi:hypothetical protein
LTSVFLGGSRKINRLNKEIKERLNNIINQQFTVLIGDANGADKAFQRFFKEYNYKNVFIYCSGNGCRNNLGNWESIRIGNESKTKNLKFYMMKDAEMANKAEYGFMLWDGKSSGTINNVLNLLSNKKKTLVYFSHQKKFHTISSIDILVELLKYCNEEEIKKINEKINLAKRMEELKSVQYELVN